MATQQVRNIINNQVDSVIGRAEKEIKNELKKQLEKAKNKLPTPDSLLKELQVTSNTNSCSEKGTENTKKNMIKY